MIIFLIVALQAGPLGLSSVAPRDERLRFEFLRKDGEFVIKDSNNLPRVSGLAASPTEWSAPVFSKIVQQCGGKALLVSQRNGSIVVTGESSVHDFDVARCVQSSTSVRFAVGIASTGYNSGPLDQVPFKSLWNR